MKVTPLRVLAFLAVIVTLAGCVTQPAGNVSTINANSTGANTNVQPMSSSSPAKSVATAPPVTLPVLDAFFQDDAFTTELKGKLNLTDDQINRLRSIARDETGKLSENGERQGTTTSARNRADELIKSVIGPEKSQQLYQFVQARWGNDPQPIALTPNSIPTDTRIVVNIPAYRMDIFENGQLTKTYLVGIGYPEFPLPTGLRKADTVIFNPTWTAPDEPWVESANKVRPGEKIPAGSKLNPLGPVKIPIGLPSLIHGGKSPSRIGTFASHGCVGLTTPQVNEFVPELARLAGSTITPEEIINYEKDKSETKPVKLNQPVPVELRYETIVAEDGKLHIYRDVYDKDTNTEENLRRVLGVYDVNFDDLSEQERTQLLDALKEMSRDPQGNLDQPGDNSNAPDQVAKNTNSPKVTRKIKGEKEITIELGALQDRGYPAPVNLNNGGAPQKKSKQSQQTAKRT
jgi:lipoprotein-anchoring transpeptidase ErfK/SrfK